MPPMLVDSQLEFTEDTVFRVLGQHCIEDEAGNEKLSLAFLCPINVSFGFC